MQISNLKITIQKSKKGFALIYTLLFIVLLLIAISATWLTGMADLRLSQKSNYSVQAYQLAQAGIDDGYKEYENQISTTDPLPDKSYPDNICVLPTRIIRVNPNVNPITSIPKTLNPPPIAAITANGSYDYRFCTDAVTHKTTIEGIGYYQGSKITLKATVTHGSDSYEQVPILDAGGLPTGQYTRKHDKDYLTIYQTGPSQ